MNCRQNLSAFHFGEYTIKSRWTVRERRRGSLKEANSGQVIVPLMALFCKLVKSSEDAPVAGVIDERAKRHTPVVRRFTILGTAIYDPGPLFKETKIELMCLTWSVIRL